MATYGDFPGVRVTTQTGGIPSVSIGREEKLVIFGPADYDNSNNVVGDSADRTTEAGTAAQINAPLGADNRWGSDSELADAMKEAIQNGANIDYLWGCAVERTGVTGETSNLGSKTGSLANYSVVEDASTITWDDDGTELTVEFRYNGAPDDPSGDGKSDTVYLNPLTGEYNADAAPTSSFSVDYDHYDWANTFGTDSVRNVVNEDETGIYWALSDSDSVSSDLNTEVSARRNDYQLVNGFCFAEPNDNEVLDSVSDTDGGADPRYDDGTYDSANQSISEDYFFKVVPARLDDDNHKTIGGGLAGMYAGSPLNDAVYNEVVSGYSNLEQSLTKSESDNFRNDNLIPVRSGASVRVKGNRATGHGGSDSVGPTFWERRIVDRVILIGKTVGDSILGRINDQQTRNAAERLINAEMQALVADRLIQPNGGDTQNWSVSVTADSTNNNQVDIQIAFTPYGIAKEIDETITVNTS